MVVGQFSQDVDILVIGGGPAGYTAAFRVAELQKTVAIVDPKETLGGECLHHACIPSKASLKSIDFEATLQTLGGALEKRCASLGIERLCGHAHFENAKTAQITGEVVSVVKFRKAIIASGSQKRSSIYYPNAVQVEEIYSDTPSDSSILIVGNTPSAIESATFLCNNNAVSLWADGDLLPTFNRKLVTLVERPLSKHVTICKERPNAENFDVVVLAGHRHPQTNSLQLENAKVQSSDGFIITNDSCQTSNQKMYAIGECSGCEHSAALAISQGRVAAEHACGIDAHLDATCVPQVVWSSPELAQCGEFDQTNTVSIPWGNSGIALALGQQKGITLLSYDPETQAITGIGIAGQGATEMIGEGVLAIEMGATLYDLATVIRPHPSRSEMLSEAARIALSTL